MVKVPRNYHVVKSPCGYRLAHGLRQTDDADRQTDRRCRQGRRTDRWRDRLCRQTVQTDGETDGADRQRDGVDRQTVKTDGEIV